MPVTTPATLSRAADGTITGIDLASRLFTRTTN